MKEFWTANELGTVRNLYPHLPTWMIARALGRSERTVYQAANRLGMKKTHAFLSSEASGRIRRADHKGRTTQFGRGHVPANKGLRRPGWGPGRMKQTQFKRGERRGVAAENWCPVGTIRTDSEGFLRIKVREGRHGDKYYGFGNTDVWPLMGRHIWEQHKGPIPAAHKVVFKDGDRSNCAIENLELISNAEMMRRNTVHRLPKELALAIQLNGALKRKLRTYAEKQIDRLAESPVRDAGDVEGQRKADGY